MNILGTCQQNFYRSLQGVARHFELDLQRLEGKNQSAIIPLPPEFLRHIEQCNREKPDAPLALILRSGKDPNHILSSTASRHNILQIAKTHRIAIRELQTGYLFGQTIREVSKTHIGKPIQLLYIFAHGNKDCMEFGEQGFWNFNSMYGISNLRATDFSPLAKNAIIMLHSCLTGLELARKMAQVSGRVVQAPVEEITDTATIFHTSNPPQLLSYNEKGEPLIHQFSPDGSEQILTVDEDTKRLLFLEKLDYILNIAKTGDREAQFALAQLFDEGIGVDRCEKTAEYWYRKAAEQGLAKAQTCLGDFYFNGWAGLERSEEKALEWFSLAAQQGDAVGQERVQLFKVRETASSAINEILATLQFDLYQEKDESFSPDVGQDPTLSNEMTVCSPLRSQDSPAVGPN